MIARIQEKRSQGGLFAFIDLLFLLVAFMVLMIFFMQLKRTSAEVELEEVQQRLEAAEETRSTLEEQLERLAPVIEKFMVRESREAEKRRAAAAKEIRKKSRAYAKLSYIIGKDGTIGYNGRVYTMAQFRVLVENLRKDKWVAFRATASPDTPFGTVVAQRRILLENSGEFDTYWDNLGSPDEPDPDK